MLKLQGLWEAPSTLQDVPSIHLTPPQTQFINSSAKGEQKKIDFFFLLTSRSVQRQQLQFHDTFSTWFFVLQLHSESLMWLPAADKTFRKTTTSGAILSPAQRRPSPRSAQSIARVFIRNMMCRVGRSSSLRLRLHSNVMESPSPSLLDGFFSLVSAALPPAPRSRTIGLDKSHRT